MPKPARKNPRGRPVGWRKKDALRVRLPSARCTREELQRAREFARRYAGGSLARWIVYAVLNAPNPLAKGTARG